MGRKALFFCAEWCGPCKRAKKEFIAPLIEQLSDPDLVQVVNVDESYSLSKKHHITHIPTLVLLNDDVLVSKDTGCFPSIEKVRTWLEGQSDDISEITSE